MSFGKGSNTTTATSTPNPAAYAAYQQLLSRAQGVADTPYQAYGGELTAPVNAQQQTGIGGINANAGFAQPYVQQAGQYINQGTQPLSAADIQKYQDPFTQQVIDATQQQFATDNARQQSQVTGNAAAQGALGGNRVGVAQALTAEGQQRAQAPVLANLRSQGYQNAVNTAQQQQQNQITGGNALAGVGIAGQGAALSGAGAQVGAGTLEQQTQQQQDLARLQEYFRQQAYPFQTTQFLAGIDTGVGSQLGGTSQTTPPQPNPWNTALGLGLAGAGLFFDKGGRVAGFAGGGVPGPDYTGNPWGDAQGWVPTVGITKGSGAPKPPGVGGQQAGLSNDQMKGAAALGRGAKDWWNKSGTGTPIDISPSAAGVDLSNAWVGPTQGFGGGLPSMYASGGAVDMSDYGRGFADAGFVGPVDDWVGPVQAGFGTGSIVPSFNDRFADAPAAPDLKNKKTRETYNTLLDAATSFPDYYAQNGLAAGPVPEPTEVKTAGVADVGNAPPVAPRGGAPEAPQTESLAYSPTAGVGEPLQTAAETTEKKSGLLGLNLSPELRQSLLAAGFGIAASRSPFLGQAIGEGGLRGVGEYGAAKEATLHAEKTKADIQHGKDQLAQQAERAREAVKQHAEQLAQAREFHDVPSGFRRGANGLEPIPGGPQDPGTIEAQTKAKRVSGLTDTAANIAARQVIGGDLSALTNYGRGAQGPDNINRIRNEAVDILVNEQNMSPEQAASHLSDKLKAYKAETTGAGAGARTQATREANLNLILKATNAAIPAALEASEKVARTGWVPINKIIQGGQVIASDPELRQFGMANLQLAEHWARAMNPTGVMRESDRDKALSFLSTADSKDTYRKVVQQLYTQITRERDAVAGKEVPPPNFETPAAGAGKPKTVIQNGHTYTLQPDGSYK